MIAHTVAGLGVHTAQWKLAGEDSQLVYVPRIYNKMENELVVLSTLYLNWTLWFRFNINGVKHYGIYE